MAKLQVVTLENLSLYDSLIKQYINAGDAKSIKKVTLEGRTLSFFKSEAEGATADFVVTIPEQDLQPLLTRIKANEDAIAAINNENTGILVQAKGYADGKVKELADGAVADNTAAIEAINHADTGILKQAKDYTDALANGAVKTNTEAVAAVKGRVDVIEPIVTTLNGADTVEGSVKAQIKAAKEELEGKITASEYDDTQVKADIKANTDAIAAINHETDGILAQAKAYADGKDAAITAAQNAADKAQGEVDALEGVVEELAQAVADNKSGVEARVKAIEDDYLKGADKTELQGNIDAVAGDVAKNTQAIATLNGEGEGSVKKAVDDAINKFATDVTDDNVINSYKELIDWVSEHGGSAAEMAEAIQTNKTDIAELAALVGSLPEDATAATVVELIQALVAAEELRATGIEGGLETRLQAVETAVGEGGSVDSQIDAKIAALDADVTSAEVEAGKGVQVQVVEVDGKVTSVAVSGNFDNAYDAKGAAATAAGTAETNAKSYADGLNGAMDTKVTGVADRVTAVEGLVGEGYEAIPEADITGLFN